MATMEYPAINNFSGSRDDRQPLIGEISIPTVPSRDAFDEQRSHMLLRFTPFMNVL
jgi:hypothetical protein